MTDLMFTEFDPETAKGQSVSLADGDICIAATYREGEVDIRRNMGASRVMVLDSDLNAKGAFYTGETGLVLGVHYNACEQVLYVSDAASASVHRFASDGTHLPIHNDQQGKPFGPMIARADGFMVIGEHIKGDKPPFIGGGAIHCFDKDGKTAGVFEAEHDPGKFGFHGVTNMALMEEGHVLYVSETGKRIMGYDLDADIQLPDYFVLPEDGDVVEENRGAAGVALTAGGKLLLSHVYGVSLMELNGTVIRDYPLEKARGWAAIAVLKDGVHFLIANIFTGRIEKRKLDDGALVASLDTGMVFTLTSMCEI